MMNEKQRKILLELVKQYNHLHQSEPDLKQYSEYLITYHSTAIEGSTLTKNEVIELLDIGKPAKNREFRYNLMVFDHHNALLYTVEAAKNKEKITEKQIRDISAMVMKNTGSQFNTAVGSFDAGKGEYRLVGVHAGRRSFPDYRKVPSLMKKLIEYIDNEQEKQDIDILQFAFEVHFRFVSIHPFADGNGRVARLLMNYVLAYYNLPMLIVSKSDRLKYIDTLYNAQENGNMIPFYNFMLRQYIKFLKSEIKQFGTSAKSINGN
jgi:Fic family protein